MDSTSQPRVDRPVRSIHLMGICGTGMGTLAAMLQEAGYRVRGSDQNVYPPMSTFLALKGIHLIQGYRPENLQPPPDLVVVGNVIRRDNPEAQAVLHAGLPYCSMPQALGRFFLNSAQSLVVAGTHGKTTTSALLTWIFTVAGLDPGCLVGGIMINFGQSHRLGHGPYFVVEGDEYDTAFFDKGPKFLHYQPWAVVLTSVEFDHADIFPNLEAVENAFRRLVAIIPAGGLLVVNADDARASRLSREARCRIITYGLRKPAEFQAVDAEYAVGATRFRVQGPKGFEAPLISPLAGAHNLSNALGLIALARELGVGADSIQQALMTFRSVRRRQEVRGEPGGITVIDDFAHHPTAVQVTIEALRPFYGGRRLWAIFEPRTNSSRRKVFQDQYVGAFDAADIVLIKEPPDMERIAPEERLSARKLVEDIAARGKEVHHFPDVESMLRFILPRVRPRDVLLIMSNGSFDKLHDKLLDVLAKTFR
jgi:UDP-N-acetylmuramate: L-alanyl-gamma-D-glutamyl-meso-diaminopimelate ligase